MIRGKTTILRPFNESDLDRYCEIVNDSSSLTPYWPSFLQSEPNLRKEFSEGGFLKNDYKVLLVTDTEGNFIGEVTSFKTSPNIQGPEVAYRIFREENRRKGYATEAVLLFSAYLFRSEANILRLTAMIRTDNVASINLIEKCGYTQEGTLRDAELFSGLPHSYHVYSLLRNECPKLEDLITKATSGS